MYEQYTDKQIVEMLKPKLTKILGDGMWDTALEHSEGGRNLIELIATIYRSAYIRGQLGRSFIIGETKQTEPKCAERWVPATKDNVKAGSKVRMIDEEAHKSAPDCYPPVSTVGVVIDNSICRILPLVQWPINSVGGDDVTHCLSRYLEVLLCE